MDNQETLSLHYLQYIFGNYFRERTYLKLFVWLMGLGLVIAISHFFGSILNNRQDGLWTIFIILSLVSLWLGINYGSTLNQTTQPINTIGLYCKNWGWIKLAVPLLIIFGLITIILLPLSLAFIKSLTSSWTNLIVFILTNTFLFGSILILSGIAVYAIFHLFKNPLARFFFVALLIIITCLMMISQNDYSLKTIYFKVFSESEEKNLILLLLFSFSLFAFSLVILEWLFQYLPLKTGRRENYHSTLSNFRVLHSSNSIFQSCFITGILQLFRDFRLHASIATALILTLMLSLLNNFISPVLSGPVTMVIFGLILIILSKYVIGMGIISSVRSSVSYLSQPIKLSQFIISRLFSYICLLAVITLPVSIYLLDNYADISYPIIIMAILFIYSTLMSMTGGLYYRSDDVCAIIGFNGITTFILSIAAFMFGSQFSNIWLVLSLVIIFTGIRFYFSRINFS